MPLFIAGTFRDRGLAERAVSALLDAGVPSKDISLAVREEAEEDVTARDEMTGGVSEFSALAVHSAWERLGWQGGARPAYRDKIPPQIDHAILAAGPLGIAIGGAQVGAAAGGVVGGMANFGFTLDTARSWYQNIVDGQAWVMVRGAETDATRIRPVFDKYQAGARAESIRHW